MALAPLITHPMGNDRPRWNIVHCIAIYALILQLCPVQKCSKGVVTDQLIPISEMDFSSNVKFQFILLRSSDTDLHFYFDTSNQATVKSM